MTVLFSITAVVYVALLMTVILTMPGCSGDAPTGPEPDRPDIGHALTVVEGDPDDLCTGVAEEPPDPEDLD